jgi:glycosyltransferase involved in cell wall biosynthesis
MMRILFVTPYPASRIRARSYGFITQLAKTHFVELLALCANTREMCDVQILQQLGIVATAIYEPYIVRYMRGLTALTSRRPLQVAFDASPRLRRAIGLHLLRGQFDLLHVELIRVLGALPSILPVPVVWDAVDCISQLYEQGGQAGITPMLRIIGASEGRRVRAYEQVQLQRFRHVLVTAERDRQALLAITQDSQTRMPGQTPAEITVIPLGIDQHYFQVYDGARQAETLIFSGKMSFHANIAGVCSLVKHILPLIWQKRPAVKLIIAGNDPPAAVRHLARDPRIEVTGYLPDLRSAIAQAQIAVCPLPYAVGMQYKVLEAMALGTPVVASTPAAAGLQAIAGRDLLVANEPTDFAAAVLRLLEDQAQWRSLAAHGVAYIRAYHHLDVIIQHLTAVYAQALEK